MRQLFISYARENSTDVDELVRHLHALGYRTWLDSSLRGGQTWWDEILQRIADSDVFVAIVSRHTLSSTACKRELQWALALDKPILPLAVERLPDALPRTLSMRQIVDYSEPAPAAAFAIAGALATLPAAPPLPEQLPDRPPAPLSYLADLVDQVSAPDPLTHEQQRQLLVQLQPALGSSDPEERRRGSYILEMFRSRGDLYADVDRNLAQIAVPQLDVASSHMPPGKRPDRATPTTPESSEEGGNLLADPRWADALSAYFAKRWTDAVEGFESLEAVYPDEARLETRLKEARRQRDIAAWSIKADTAAAKSDWDTLVTALENLTALEPAYPDARSRLEQARIAQRCKSLIDEMIALHKGRRWKAVVAAAQELMRLNPDNVDPGGIVSDAKNKLRDAELADRYAQALNHLDKEEWRQAADLLVAIEREQPGYRDAGPLLNTARGHFEYPHVLRRPSPRPPRGDAARMPQPEPEPTAALPTSSLSSSIRTEVPRKPARQKPDASAQKQQAGREPSPTRRRRLILSAAVLLGACLAIVGAFLLIRLLVGASAPTVIATIPVGTNPQAVAVNPGTRTVYVANFGDNNISVIDESTKKVVDTVPVGRGPNGVAVDTATHTVYVTNDMDNSMSVIDGSTRQAIATIPVGANPKGVAVDSATHTVYVTNLDDSSVSVIDGSTHKVTITLSVGKYPNRVAVDAATHVAYVTDLGAANLSVLGAATQIVLDVVPIGRGPYGVAVDADTDTIYAANSFDNAVSVIDGSLRQVTGSVVVGSGPYDVAVDPSTHTAYVTNKSDNTVSIIDGSTRRVTATVPVGELPMGVAVNPDTRTAYVANDMDNTVSVIQSR